MSETYIRIEKDGSKSYYKDPEMTILHREDGPAIESPNRTVWYKDNTIHRKDGPAVVDKFAGERWYLNGEYHRVDGPAVIRKDGTKEWYLNGKRHRENGPALESENSEEWWFNDKRHRLDGPAAIYKKVGLQEYFVNDVKYVEPNPNFPIVTIEGKVYIPLYPSI
jgi:hypothetical protein